MLAYQVYTRTKDRLQIVGCRTQSISLCWHNNKKINIAVTMMLIFGNRPEKSHITDSVGCPQYIGMTFEYVYVFLSCLHKFTFL